MSQMSSKSALRQALKRKRREIAAEIQSYPSPIAGCDAQFNGLLDDRRRILAGLRLLETLAPGQTAPEAAIDQTAFTKQAQLTDILDR